ncbi:MAG: hypothetical protein M3228_10405 [Actinomycetota bacterium]|nr:hypothetical protein [Actinomycetota bacterium]
MLPAVQASSGSTDGELGTALLMIGLGALMSMRLTVTSSTASVPECCPW